MHGAANQSQLKQTNTPQTRLTRERIRPCEKRWPIPVCHCTIIAVPNSEPNLRQIALPSLSLIALLGVCCACYASDHLQPFATDGCSSFPDGTNNHETLWRLCCVTHDVAYWRGGTYDERLEADRALKRCVEERGESKIAKLMYSGVRVGGTPYSPTPFRWGFGWPYPRGYKALTEAEKELAENLAPDPDSLQDM